MRQLSYFRKVSVVGISLWLAACSAATPLPTLAPTTIPTATAVAAPAATLEPTTIPFMPLADGARSFDLPNNKMFVGTVYGQGETAIIVASGIAGGPSRWQPFVDEIDTEKFTVITYAYTQFTADGAIEETGVILNLLRESGYQRVICVGMSLGVTSCGSISDEPEIIGMVLVAGPENAAGQHDGNCYCESLATSTYPKLFIAGADDQYAADTQQLYEQASEPKTLKLYPGNAYRAAHLLESKDGEDILAQLLGFIDNLS